LRLPLSRAPTSVDRRPSDVTRVKVCSDVATLEQTSLFVSHDASTFRIEGFHVDKRRFRVGSFYPPWVVGARAHPRVRIDVSVVDIFFNFSICSGERLYTERVTRRPTSPSAADYDVHTTRD
jgi:hypothetical protein